MLHRCPDAVLESNLLLVICSLALICWLVALNFVVCFPRSHRAYVGCRSFDKFRRSSYYSPFQAKQEHHKPGEGPFGFELPLDQTIGIARFVLCCV